jgi:hypothetical protein
MTSHNPVAYPLFAVTAVVAIALSGFSISRVETSAVDVESQLSFFPNIETVGVALSGVNLPASAEMVYRQSGEANWRPGHRLVRIDDGRLIGSLFGLAPSTTYEVKVLVGTVETSGVVTTQPEELTVTATAILHVNDDAPEGGDGSAGAPFRSIQEAIDRAGPGTQVLVGDGIYHEAVTFPASGTAGAWIQVKAQGSGAILDGSQTLTGKVWTAHPSKAKVWYTRIGSSIAYLARDGKRFYKYDDLSGLVQSRGHGNVTMNEGWYFDPGTFRLYIRSQDDPAGHSWQVPNLNHAFEVNGRDWIWIEGLEMRFYGTRTDGCGICTLNASHVVVRDNKIHNMQLGIYVNWNGTENQGNDTRIENNEIYDPLVNEFPWQAVKGSSMEGTGIVVRGHIGAIVRGNDIHNFFNGIYTGTSGARIENPAVAFDADIYNNYIHNISDDALEPEGACVNHRFRNNIIDSTFVGVSLAPITQGPTWVLRSVIGNYTSRSLKWALNSDGVVFVYHNTSWTKAGNVNAMDLITPVRNSVIQNNIFQSSGYAFAEVPTGSAANDWNHNNWYTTRGSSGPHFKWESVNYSTVAQVCTATGLECQGYEDGPGFANPEGGDFRLLPSSPNIDRGELIPGINDDFKWNAPDVGAFEFTLEPSPKVLSILRADANPTNAANINFTVTFSEPVTGVDIAAPFNDFALSLSSTITGASITGVTPVSETTYIVGIHTGAGNGTIRLDVLDDDSIINSNNQPLGGAGTANGGFSNSEAYTINKSITATVSASFASESTYDGWILESSETSRAGGTFDKKATTLNAGDDQKDRQYRSILSFDTSPLPNNAVIVSAQLKVKRQDVVGADPFQTHGILVLEIRKGVFGSSTELQAGDFSALASSGALRDSLSALTSSWYAAQLSTTNLALINKAGRTQFRLFFSKDDNDDLDSDYMKFFAGNSTDENKPELLVTYYLP